MGILPRNNITSLTYIVVILIVLGIVLIVKDRKQSKVKEDDEETYNNALNKIKELKKNKSIVVNSLMILQLVISFIIAPIIFMIMMQDFNYFALLVVLDKTLVVACITYIVFHIIWAVYEEKYVQKKILNDSNLDNKEKSLLCNSFSTSIVSIIGSCLLFEAVSLILKVIQ